jgi:hypothetical protein
MAERFHTLRAASVAATLDLFLGHLVRLEVDHDGRRASPLHRAPWADDPTTEKESDTAPNVMGLGGDFFCAPFGGNDIEPAPTHGWPANTPWRLLGETSHPRGGVVATFELERSIFGARVTKEWTLRDGHPFLYQRHVLSGGNGGITAAHHVNTHFSATGRLDFSPKAYADIPSTPLETDPARGRFVLSYPARTGDLSALPLAAGGTADLHHYPIGERHEDFVMLVEAAGSQIGWTSVLDEAERDLLLVLKDPTTLPVTLLWFSNGGRDYPPWSGRHVGVLGIEDARCWSLYGHRASLEQNPLGASGIPTSFDLRPGGRVEIRHVIGACPAPDGWAATERVAPAAAGLAVSSRDGHTLLLPFDPGFLTD